MMRVRKLNEHVTLKPFDTGPSKQRKLEGYYVLVNGQPGWGIVWYDPWTKRWDSYDLTFFRAEGAALHAISRKLTKGRI